jgi:hypothetical protein
MMRLRILVVPAVLLAVALPAQARAGEFSGVVVAKQPQRGTLLVAGAHGVGLTVRGSFARALVGERIALQGVRLHDGTFRTSRLQVLSRVRAETPLALRLLIGPHHEWSRSSVDRGSVSSQRRNQSE